MTLERTLLEKLAEWRCHKDTTPLTVAGPEGWIATLVLERNDEMAACVREVVLSRNEPVTDVQVWSEQLCSRVTGLLEPLMPIEFDASCGILQLRSQAPSRRGQALAYYEVFLHARGEATVRRFQAAADGSKRREQIGFALTHEVLAKLVDDLIASG